MRQFFRAVRSSCVRLVCLVLLCSGLAACSKNGDRLTCYPVRGRVLVKGKPAEEALVIFYPLSSDPQARSASGVTDAEGYFLLSTYDSDDGAPAGEYEVGITWQKDAFKRKAGPDKLGGRYSNPKKSKLRAKVEPGDNELPPFSLQ